MGPFSQYNQVVGTGTINPPQQSFIDIQFVCPNFAEDIRKGWDIPDDIVKIAEGVEVLTYQRVLAAGKDHLRQILSKRLRRHPEMLDKIWERLLVAQSQESSFFR